MSDHNIKARLRRATAEALARSTAAAAENQTSEVPRPGEVYTLRASVAWPVEWVVLESDSADPGRLLAVPADTQPLAGRNDLSISDDAPAGPLTLRVGRAVVLPRDAFDPRLRSRCLSPEDIKRACEHRRRIEDDTLGASALEEEAELDADYQDWMREVTEPARAAVGASVSTNTQPLPFPRPPVPKLRPRPWITAVAAVLAVVSVGLSFLVVAQRRELGRQGEPRVVPAVEQIRFLDPPRTTEIWRLPRGPVILHLVGLEELHGCASLRVEFLDSRQRLLWTLDSVEIPPEDRLRLVLPRRFLERSPARLRLLGLCEEEPRLLEQRRLQIRWE